jgi:hypothetical protein
MRLERTNYFSIVFALTGDYLDVNLKRVLAPLGMAITESGATIDEMTSRFESPWVDSWVDDEVGIIEELLGVAFVACQTFITHIVTHIMRIHKHAAKQGVPLMTVGDISLMTPGQKKVAITRYGYAGEDGYSPIEVINAFANYYKHNDEWRLNRVNWDDPTGLPAHTIPVISFAGAEEGSTGNLRSGAENLGNLEYKDLTVFAAHISTWRKSLINAYRAELISKRLISSERIRKKRWKKRTAL